jgi:hypothetical protein
VFRERIDHALAYAGGSAIPFRRDIFQDGARATVNQPLPVLPDPAEWATILAVLPDIPPELEYIVWGADLALVDVSANLVLDVLENALPAWPSAAPIYR